jgi:hypothetical protein
MKSRDTGDMELTGDHIGVSDLGRVKNGFDISNADISENESVI